MDVEWTSWIGRRERSADRVTAAPAAALAATLDRDDPLLAMAVTATLA